ncbi:MAG: hypothetical protein M0T80_02545 [Actinomycetota bacterium]|nr:hypothetical protein [Actinomycetota bacterium]
MTDQGCGEVSDLLAELALGVADAEGRAGALAHLEICAGCQAELRSFADTADALASLAPEVEPPAGFEQRVLSTLGAARRGGVPAPAGTPATCAGPPRPSRSGGSLRRTHARRPSGSPAPPGRGPAGWSRRARHRALLASAAAVVVVGLAAAGLALSGAGGKPAPAKAVLTGALVSGHRHLGQVVVMRDRSALVSVAVHGEAGVAWVRCELVDAGGKAVTIGKFALSDGSGDWAAGAGAAAWEAHEALLVDAATGRVVARAELAAS